MPNTVTNSQFRLDFPEFANTTAYPDSVLTTWLTLAETMLNTAIGGPRWGAMLVMGEELFTAHNLALWKMNSLAAAAGGVPGVNRGVISSETPGEVSVSYDTNAGVVKDAGHWNLTTYGTRFMWLVRIVGTGGIQIGTCGGVGNSSGGGWGSGYGSGFGFF